ncbi:MAG: hypothetical protein JWM11_7565, partial [Planctomycetaceae bacterium]|nr:hypothetical protein [Planctomycetaceae bacterium]
YIKKFPYLKSLTLTRGQATDKGLESLKGLAHLEFVCLLSAWGLTDSGMAHVAALPRLTRFCTDRAEQLTDETLRQFGHATNLRDLVIDGGRFSDIGLQHLKSLKTLKNLRIGSAEPLITDQGLAELAGHVTLESLSLENTKITDAGLKHLHGMLQLTELDLSGSEVTPAGLAGLSKVLPKLKLSESQKDHETEQPAKPK